MRRASAIVTFSVIALAILYGFPGRTVAQGGDVWIKITGIKTQEPMPQYPSRFQVNISINYDSGLGPESAAIEVWIEDRATGEIVDIIQGPANGAPGAFNLASDTVTLLVPTVKEGTRLLRIYAKIWLGDEVFEDFKDLDVGSGPIVNQIPEFDTPFLLLGVLVTFVLILQMKRSRRL